MKHVCYKNGDIINNIIFIKELPNISTLYKRMCLFECFCGNKFKSNLYSIKKGNIKSCGCLRFGARKPYKHGLSKDRLYAIWGSMKNRCYNKNNNRYKDYGGRGISVCDEWRNDFLSFYNYMSELPNVYNKNYSIDRINNNDDYKPSNVKMSTHKEQCQNKRTRRAYNSTGHQGVYPRYGRFFSSVTHKNKVVHIGTFETIKEAVKARANYIKENKIANRLA